MFEDILGKEKEIKKPKNRVNVMPKGLAKAKVDSDIKRTTYNNSFPI